MIISHVVAAARWMVCNTVNCIVFVLYELAAPGVCQHLFENMQGHMAYMRQVAVTTITATLICRAYEAYEFHPCVAAAICSSVHTVGE